MAQGEVLKVIRSVLGKSLTFEQAQQLTAASVPVAAKAGTLVFKEGDRPEGLLILTRGKVEVFREVNGTVQQIAAVDAPTVLGEMGLLLERGHTASVRAVTDCEFMLLTRTQFQRLIEADSLAAYKLMATIAEVLARRLHLMDEKVIELRTRTPAAAATPPVEELQAFKQKLFSDWSF
jgi:CRP/FNR family transcriptional regulator, cyclic AMP receptor protein